MSAKRGATSYLTDRNWDQEDEEEEEAGIFVQASEDQLQQRKIKTAKRRGVAGGDEAGPKSAFAGFSGFSSIKPTGATFNFESGTKALSGLAGNKTISSTNIFTSSSNSFTFKSSSGSSVTPNTTTAISKGTPNTSSLKVSNGSEINSDSTTPKRVEKKSEYLRQLKNLNLSISEWIKKHLDENPYCVLTPVFTDYEKYLGILDTKYPEGSSSSNESGAKSDGSSDKADSGEKEDSTKAISEGESKQDKTDTGFNFKPGTGFTFGQIQGSSEITTNTLSSSVITTSTSAGFSFGTTASSGGVKPFSLVPSAGSITNTGETKANGDDEYVPPDVEITTVQEEDSLYTKRCKLFYQKEGSWVEKGVGNLHLKAIGEKTQLVIRADTNLGNILLNIMLSSSIPIRRQGKNNVSMMCIPNPPIDPKKDQSKPTMLLIRVKTADDADELHNKMTEFKG